MLLGSLGRSRSGMIAQRINTDCREVAGTLLEKQVLIPRINMLGFEITERIGPVKSSWYSFVLVLLVAAYASTKGGELAAIGCLEW